MINQIEASQSTIFGWPLFLIMSAIFVLNFFICRAITISLIKNEFIKYKSEEFQKCLITWFCPIAGISAMVMLYIVHNTIRFINEKSKTIFLTHLSESIVKPKKKK